VARALDLIFGIGWGLFWLYWLAAAFTKKRGRVPWSRELAIRVVIVIIVIVLARLGVFRHHDVNTNVARGALGILFLALGLGFAIWARVSIGRNWGMPMTQSNDPELVTSGPYRLVRHPIYSGLLLALLGTAVALSWLWLIAAGLAAGYFVYSAIVEERFLTSEFPDAFIGYRNSTKMLVPFIL
jgi:protein-S-isoprenylcysteine O-methyltransferase Ste14